VQLLTLVLDGVVNEGAIDLLFGPAHAFINLLLASATETSCRLAAAGGRRPRWVA
jgi:hypothetical protein